MTDCPLTTPSLMGYGTDVLPGAPAPGRSSKPRKCGRARARATPRPHKPKRPEAAKIRLWKNQTSESSPDSLDGMVPVRRGLPVPWLPGPVMAVSHGMARAGSELPAMGAPTTLPEMMPSGPAAVTTLAGEVKSAQVVGPTGAPGELVLRNNAMVPAGGTYQRIVAVEGSGNMPAVVSDVNVAGPVDLSAARYPVHMVRCRLGGPVVVGAAPVTMSDCYHDGPVYGSGPVDVHVRGGVWRTHGRAFGLHNASGRAIMERCTITPTGDTSIVEMKNSTADVLVHNNVIRPVGERGVLRMVEAKGNPTAPGIVTTLGNTVVLPPSGWIASPGRMDTGAARVTGHDQLFPLSQAWTTESKVERTTDGPAIRIMEASGSMKPGDMCVVMQGTKAEVLRLPPAHQMKGYTDVYAYSPVQARTADGATVTVDAGSAARFCPHPDGQTWMVFR